MYPTPDIPKFPEPGSYVRYFDVPERSYKYLRLLKRRLPLIYPFRMPEVAAGAWGNAIQMEDINPSKDKHHRYFVYIGFGGGFNYQLWHPYDVRTLKFDEQLDFQDDDLQGFINDRMSPIDHPTKAIALEYDRYPAIRAKNVSDRTMTPQLIFVGALYNVQEDDQIDPDIKTKLDEFRIKSYPWDFGGEM